MNYILSLFTFLLVTNLQAQFAYDTLLNETALYIGGMPCETEDFKKLQEKSFYSSHLKFTESSWKEMQDSTLNPMIKWAKEKNIISESDTGSCFYPFSGPDFLFADQFFPYCKNYILLGLERLGSLTDIKKLTDAQLADYLNSIRNSQRYLLKSGYFVTSHMGSDFSKSVLNGNIHLMSYFLVRTNHKIVSVNYGNINKEGTFSYATQKNSNGIEIKFFRSGEPTIKTMYYFSMDVADYKIKSKTEIEKFFESFPMINTYIKSASYIPMHKNFSIIRNIILDNSLKIVQDDTGVPLKSLDATVFEINMWGTYSKTISDLSWGFQPDLKKALEESDNNQSLPFKISYNGNYGEGMILYAKRKLKN